MTKKKINEIQLVFDDEPLERILYGDDLPGATPADVFMPVKKMMYEIRSSFAEEDFANLLRQLSGLLDADLRISVSIYKEILDQLRSFVPQNPNPELKYELSGVSPILEKIWDFARQGDDYSFRDTAGNALYRCYEHCHLYGKARVILQEMVQTEIQRHQASGEAVYTNNLAFEYLFEQKWKEAAPLFENAAQIFFNLEDIFNWANSRANYWTCAVEFAELEELETAEEELHDIAEILRKIENWRERKPHMVLARIHERKGNIEQAIFFVQKAISCAKDSGTKWPKLDELYLRELRKKLPYT